MLSLSELTEVKQYCASALRKNLSNFSEGNFTNLWSKLTQETHQNIKSTLFACIQKEANANIRSLICDAIGEIGGSLLEEEDQSSQKWPEFLPTIWQLFSHQSEVQQECGFRILSNVLMFASGLFDQYKNEVAQIIEKGVKCSTLTLRSAAITCLGNFVAILEPSELKKYDQLSIPLLQSTLEIVLKDEDEGQDCLEVIDDICENEPAFFKKNLTLLFDTMY